MSDIIMNHDKGKDPMYKTWHASRRHMFIYMYSDGGSIVCNEKIYPINKGALCFIGASKYHYTMPENPDLYDRSKLFILPEKFNKVFDVFSYHTDLHRFSEGGFVYSVIDESERAEVDKVFREVEKYQDDDRYSEAVVFAACLKLVILIDKYSTEHIAPSSGFMNRALEYINSNIFRDIDINEICAAVHISKYHFCRRFRENTGMTVMNYILKTRIVLAKNILLTEKASVTEVSSRCGFSSVSYFCRAFKEETGVTPLEYRKKNVKAKGK
ncbi:MAG: helix-turn-helix transcriptional regulator [Clostridia bacterium]|nr:helix-turn-helix transcriptional regulator [Clostridia bacterium]